MTYYCIQSWQNDSNGRTIGEEILKEEQGAMIPKNVYINEPSSMKNNVYFSTYEEAKAFFDSMLKGYYDLNVKHIHIDRYDKITGERSVYDA